jgi:hypothetical protein
VSPEIEAKFCLAVEKLGKKTKKERDKREWRNEEAYRIGAFSEGERCCAYDWGSDADFGSTHRLLLLTL